MLAELVILTWILPTIYEIIYISYNNYYQNIFRLMIVLLFGNLKFYTWNTYVPKHVQNIECFTDKLLLRIILKVLNFKA